MTKANQVAAIILASTLACFACGRKGARTKNAEVIVADNPALLELYDQDQADRSAGDAIDWTIVTQRDSLRRERVLALLDSAKVVTSEDYRHAAMVFQHGADTTAARIAHSLARTAVELDSANVAARWLTAAAWDRYQMRLGLPQWYGTQFVKDNPDDPWRLYDIDTTAVTDEERAQAGVPTLAEARARAVELNRAREE